MRVALNSKAVKPMALICRSNWNFEIRKSKLTINLFTQQLSREILKVLGKLTSPSKKSSLKPLN